MNLNFVLLTLYFLIIKLIVKKVLNCKQKIGITTKYCIIITFT